MSDDGRKQSPHYIPELDPANPESGPKDKQRVLWFLFIVGTVLLFLGGGAFIAGYEWAGYALGGIGLLMLLLLVPLGL